MAMMTLMLHQFLNNLGINLAQQNHYKKALELSKEALQIRVKKLPTNHIEIADTLFNIANILDDSGDLDGEAITFYVQALSTYRSNFGDENVDVANCCKSLGLIYIRQGDLAKATEKSLQVLRIFRLIYGEMNAEVGSLLYSLGKLYGKQL